jgi:hypothetical protein
MRSEVFQLLSLKIDFDVEKARKIIKQKKKTLKRISITRLSPALAGVSINHKHAKTSDLSDPIIIGTIANLKFLMDGHHRLTRAEKEKRTWLRYYELTEKETRECAKPKKLYDKLCYGLPYSVVLG